jgi:2-oxoisovalerate dehydrogenase E2 component (dihydrolipoyl transacylase)
LSVTIELPHVGESVVEGTIGKWLKQPGDTVGRYEPLVEVITDKVTMEVPSPVNGSLLKVLAQEGETIPMGAPIAEMETDEVFPETTPAPSPELVPVKERPNPEEQVSTTGYLVKDVAPVGPTGGGVEPTEALRPAAADQASGSRLSPAVRRLVQEHGVDINQVKGSGMGGRITRDDVLTYLQSGPAATAKPTAPISSAAPAVGASSEHEEEHLPLTPVRRMIADAMVRSVSQIPHAWSMVEVDVTDLVALRVQVRADFEKREGVDLTYLPFIIQAVAASLKEHLTLNASWGGDKIILKKKINVGIAVAAPEGLIVPVIRDADQMSVASLASAARDLTQRARQGKLTLIDVQGGTFTLNNTGALGSIVSQPIINYPQAAIMTTEAIQRRGVVLDDSIAIRSMMNLCLSFDHRINDGAESSGFLQAVKQRLEGLASDSPIY